MNQIDDYEIFKFYEDEESGDNVFELVMKDEVIDKKIKGEKENGSKSKKSNKAKLTTNDNEELRNKKATVYYVTHQSADKDHTCEHYCKFCLCCPHQFRCTCYEFSINRQTCKHIHMIANEFELNLVNIEPPEVELTKIVSIDYDLDDSVSFKKNLDSKILNTITNTVSDKETDLENCFSDCLFLTDQLKNKIEEFKKNEDLDNLIKMKNKLKCFSVLDNKDAIYEIDSSKKRKLDHQKRF